jgi:group I intron endonuclease
MMSPNNSFNTSNNNSLITPVAVYPDAFAFKEQIIRANKGKAGIYRWTNKLNGKKYIGSSVDLGRRFSEYYSITYLTKNNMAIYKAIIKYGHTNFKLEILECCDPKDVEQREQYYLDNFQREYNISPTVGSCLGRKHSDATKAKIKEASRKA